MKIGFDVSQTGAMRAGCGYVAFSLICTAALFVSYDAHMHVTGLDLAQYLPFLSVGFLGAAASLSHHGRG